MRTREQSHRSSNVVSTGTSFDLHYLDHHQVYARASKLRAAQFNRLVIAPIGRALRVLADSVRTYRREQGTVDALSRLSDATLYDIGLHRSEIRRVAREYATGGETATERQHTPAIAANDDHAYPVVDRLAS